MGDKPFSFEFAQGFAHWRSTNSEFIGERIAAQPFAWREVAMDDAVAQRLIDRVGGGTARFPFLQKRSQPRHRSAKPKCRSNVAEPVPIGGSE